MTDTEKQSPATDYRLRLPALVEYRAGLLQKHAAAFCDVPEFVMGCPVQPITPRTFSMLIASRNRFVVGGAGPGFDDVVNFIWIHSPLYAVPGSFGWRSRKRMALKSFVREIRQPWRRWVGLKPRMERQAGIMVLALGEIRTLIADAFACSSAGNSDGPTPGSLDAQMVNLFAAAYSWEPEQTRNTPLAQLFQLARCLSVSRGGKFTDRNEENIIAAHLARRLADLRKSEGESHG